MNTSNTTWGVLTNPAPGPYTHPLSTLPGTSFLSLLILHIYNSADDMKGSFALCPQMCAGFTQTWGELMHRFICVKNTNVVFMSETFLDTNVSTSYTQIKGYSVWVRKVLYTGRGSCLLLQGLPKCCGVGHTHPCGT